ncbi:unnamed protein product [Dicrocoelium dendriticum]|nr:unnamed protein product [Dicrocoelium dendriticum]
MQGRVHFGEPLERACRTTKSWLVQKKADRTSTSAAAKRCAWEWSLPPPHPPRAKTTLVPRRNDHGPTEKRLMSRGEAILVPRKSDPRPAEKRHSSRGETTSVRVRVLENIPRVGQSIEGEGWGM